MNSTERYEQNYYNDYRKPLLSGSLEEHDEQVMGSVLQAPKQLKLLLPLLNQMPVSLIVFDPVKGLIWANSHFFELLNGDNTSNDNRRRRRQLFPKKDDERIRKWVFARANSTQEEIEVQIWSQANEKQRVRLRRLSLPFGLNPEEASLLMVESLPESKEREGHLERAFEETRKSQEVQQRFLASMSHEIRNSANVIGGIVQTVQEGYFSHNELQHLKYTTDLLLHLTENLLCYSKIKEDKFKLAPGPFNLQELLSSLAQVPVVFLRQSRVGFEFYQDPLLPDYCIGDKAAIYQILLNLLSNALKFTQEGSIALLAKTAGKDARGRVVVQFQVKDSGPGIPDDQLAAIFGRFQQCKVQGVRVANGSGLGLTISQHLAELMGGQVTVDSKIGQGSTFSVLIPLEEAPALQPRLSSRQALFQCSSPIRVLLLEDDPLSRSYLEGFLQNEGFAFHSCTNGQEALSALDGQLFDLALLDLHTPLLNGYEVAFNLRNSPDNPNCGIPLIALSGGYFPEEEPKLAKAGINHFLNKPYCLEALKRLLWQHTPKQREKFQFSPGFDLQELSTLYGDNYPALQRMFDAFLRNIPNDLDKMAEALEQENWAELARRAHKAMPSFSLVGWRPVSNLAKKVEEECLNSNEKSRINQQFLGFRVAAIHALEAVAKENQRIIPFCPPNTPYEYAYPDRR